MRDVKISGDCGINKTEAKLVISWPKKEKFYQMAMEFSREAAATPSRSMKPWEMRNITFNATLQNNTDFKNPSGKMC